MTSAKEIIRYRKRLFISRRELAMLAGVMQRTMERIERGRFRQGREISRMVDGALAKLPIPPCFGDADGRCPLAKNEGYRPTAGDCYRCQKVGRKRRENAT